MSKCKYLSSLEVSQNNFYNKINFIYNYLNILGTYVSFIFIQ